MTRSAYNGAAEAAAEVIETFNRYITLIGSIAARGDGDSAGDLQDVISFAVKQLRDMEPAWKAIHVDALAAASIWEAAQDALLAEQAVQAAAPGRRLRLASG